VVLGNLKKKYFNPHIDRLVNSSCLKSKLISRTKVKSPERKKGIIDTYRNGPTHTVAGPGVMRYLYLVQLLGLFLQVTILNGQFGVLVDNFAQLILLSTGHTHRHTRNRQNILGF
jgi:hypothetical protein